VLLSELSGWIAALLVCGYIVPVTSDVSDFLHLVYEYRWLLACRRTGMELSGDQQARLRDLERRFSRDPEGHEATGNQPSEGGAFASRPGCRWPPIAAVLRIGRERKHVMLTSVSGGGVSMMPPIPMEFGDRATLTVANPRRRTEYHYPVQFSWVRRQGRTGDFEMGMDFVGLPWEETAMGEHSA